MPGGSSDKVGNRYEDRWTVRCIFSVLDEEAETIRLEPPGSENDGVEFWIQFPDRVEYQQCKRQRTREGHWNITALAKVLSTFKDKLKDTDARCVFVSTHAADALDELAERARSAESLQEFTSASLASKEWQTKFDALRQAWDGVTAEWAYQALRRIFVTTIGESELEAMNQLQAEVVLAGDTGKAVAVLTAILRERTGQSVAANDLWAELGRVGYEPNPWRFASHLAVQVAAVNQRFSASREITLIGGHLIDRTEATELRELVNDNRVVVVDGVAGAGKSDVLFQFIRGLAADGIPHLAIRLDRATPTTSPDAIGSELNLPASPAVALAALARGRFAVLVIDQLDIVSATSGRAPGFLDCVNEIIRFTSSLPNLHVVLCCRTFDLQNDHRLRRMVASGDGRCQLTVGPLRPKQVVAAVDSFGLDPARLSTAQIALLATPLHLALFGEIATSTSADSPIFGFATVGDLFRGFWQRKRKEVEERLGRTPAWTEILDVLVDSMSERQLLQAPAELADQWESDLTAMISCHVLTNDGTNVAFFHETFFDYVFARRFVGRGRLVAQLLATDQDLFRRAQIRQILAYNRDRSEQYAADLDYLLTDDSIRFHLRELVVAWLAESVPTEREWQLLRVHLDDPKSSLHTHAWRTLASGTWFEIADNHGYLRAALASGDDARIELALHVLVSGNGRYADRGLELLAQHLMESPEWVKRFSWFVQRVGLGARREIFVTFVELLRSGVLTDVGFLGREFWYLADDLPDSHPDWANELLGLYLEWLIAQANRKGLLNPFDRSAGLVHERSGFREYICKSAEADPESFFHEVWQHLKAVVAACLAPDGGSELRRDDVWPVRSLGLDNRFEEDLLAGAVTAFQTLARRSPSDFIDLARNLYDTRSESIVYLLFEGFAANAEVFADEAIGGLVSRPGWLAVSWSTGSEWGTRRLLEAVTPFASSQALADLDPALLSTYTPWERTADGRQAWGWTQFALLQGIAEERRSDVVRKRISEWQRKFKCEDVPTPKGMVFGVVQPPISDASAKRMSDSNWMEAIAQYSGEERRPRGIDPLVGGAQQLSSVLERNASEEPDRFARLAVRLPDDTDVRYFDAILRGVAASALAVTAQDAAELVRRCDSLPGRPCGRWIARPLLRHTDTPLSRDMIEMLTWYASNDPDPLPGNAFYGYEDERLDERLLGIGLNSVRGAVAGDIVQLISGNHANVEPLMPAIQRLITDEAAAVRACAAQITLAMLNVDSNRAVDLFEELTADCPEELLANRYVTQFLRYRVGADFQRVLPVTERMLRSPLSEVQMHGAAVACLASLSEPAAADLAEECLRGTEKQRLGAARVYAANLTTSRFRANCVEALIKLFDDDSQVVRDSAAMAIREFSGNDLEVYEELATVFLCSAAAADNWDALLQAIVDSTSACTSLALTACEKVLSASSGADIRESVAYRPDLVSQILLRIYTDGANEIRSHALDLIDWSLRQNIYGIGRVLAEHDRDWRTRA